MMVRMKTILSSVFWRWSSPFFTFSRLAVLPRKVCWPVEMTVASTSPRVTVLPSFGSLPAVILTGSDSPVQQWQCPAWRQGALSARRQHVRTHQNDAAGFEDGMSCWHRHEAAA